MEKAALALILLSLAFGSPSEAAKKKRSPKVEVKVAPPAIEGAEVRALIAQKNLESALQWLRVQKSDFSQQHIFFFDTEDLSLLNSGLILRVRRFQDDSYDTVVKIRAQSLTDIPRLSSKAQRSLDCEIDAGIVGEGKTSCQYTKKEKKVLPSIEADNFGGLFNQDHRKLAKHQKPDLDWSKLKIYGRINSSKWTLTSSEGLNTEFELWTLPNSTRILTVSTKSSFEKDPAKLQADLQKRIKEWGFEYEESDLLKTDRALEIIKSSNSH